MSTCHIGLWDSRFLSSEKSRFFSKSALQMITKPLEPVQGHPWLCKTRKKPAVLAVFTWQLVGFTVFCMQYIHNMIMKPASYKPAFMLSFMPYMECISRSVKKGRKSQSRPSRVDSDDEDDTKMQSSCEQHSKLKSALRSDF